MRRITIGSLAVGAMFLTAPAAAATPNWHGCPAGFLVWEIQEDDPYRADAVVDEEGNGDGTVCARELGRGLNRQYGVDFPIYLFMDN